MNQPIRDRPDVWPSTWSIRDNSNGTGHQSSADRRAILYAKSPRAVIRLDQGSPSEHLSTSAISMLGRRRPRRPNIETWLAPHHLLTVLFSYSSAQFSKVAGSKVNGRSFYWLKVVLKNVGWWSLGTLKLVRLWLTAICDICGTVDWIGDHTF